MRKALGVFLSMTLAASMLVGCGGTGATSSTEQQGAAQETEAAEPAAEEKAEEPAEAPEKPKVKAKVKAKGKKSKGRHPVKITPVAEEKPEEHHIEDDIPEGHYDFYEGDDAPHGTFTENDEIYELYELLKTARDMEDPDDENPFKHKD